MDLVYLDACVIIEGIEKPTMEGQAVVDLIAEAAGNETPFLTSELSLLEVLVVPVRGRRDRSPGEELVADRSHHDWYLANLVHDGILVRTTPVTRDILIQAAVIRARVRSIKTPDAIHVATALRSGCKYFVTADDELARKLARDHVWRTSDRRVEFIEVSASALTDLAAKLRS